MNKIILDEYGNALIPNPLLDKGKLPDDRTVVVGHHAECGEEMSIMPISATHVVLSCDGRCRFSMHVPRNVHNLEALRDNCFDRNRPKHAAATAVSDAA